MREQASGDSGEGRQTVAVRGGRAMERRPPMCSEGARSPQKSERMHRTQCSRSDVDSTASESSQFIRKRTNPPSSHLRAPTQAVISGSVSESLCVN
eukprot:659363-Rhodomonas_salina.1